MANRIFNTVGRVANTLFGRPWGIPRPQDGTGTAPKAPSPPPSYGPQPPYTPPFQLRDDPPPEADISQLAQDYAAAQVGLAAYYRSLPPWIDDLTRGLGDDLYARMGLDDQIFSSTRNVVRQVLADGLTLRPAVDDEDDPDYEQAADYCERAERMLADLSAGLPQSMDTILQEALHIGAGMGHKVFELVYEPGEDGWTNLARIKSKPRRSTAFVVNPYNDLVGMLVRLPGMALPALASVTDLRSMPILPFDKFAVLTHLQEDNDPRGNSLWRAAYARWWEKLQIARDYMRYLGQFAMPSLVGELPETSTDEPATDQFGNIVANAGQISQAQAFVNQLVAFRNGSAIAHPHGAKVYTVFAASSGEAFIKALDRCDRQIDKVITGQVLAGQEAEHGTRAQAETHQDTAGGNLPYYRGLLEALLNRQILCRWLRLNVGEEEARRLAPKATLKKIEEQDRGEAMQSYAGLYTAGVLKPSQLPYVHEQLGLPPADPEELTSPAEDAMALQTVGKDQDAEISQKTRDDEHEKAQETRDDEHEKAKEAEMTAPAGPAAEMAKPEVTRPRRKVQLIERDAAGGIARITTTEEDVTDAAFADDAGGHWVTIGAHGEEGDKHGGTHVFLKDGKITKGPKAMIGKSPAHLGKTVKKDHGPLHPETGTKEGPPEKKSPEKKPAPAPARKDEPPKPAAKKEEKPGVAGEFKPGAAHYEKARAEVLDALESFSRTGSSGRIAELHDLYPWVQKSVTPDQFRQLVDDLDRKGELELHVRNEVRELSPEQRSLAPEREGKVFSFVSPRRRKT